MSEIESKLQSIADTTAPDVMREISAFWMALQSERGTGDTVATVPDTVGELPDTERLIIGMYRLMSRDAQRVLVEIIDTVTGTA